MGERTGADSDPEVTRRKRDRAAEEAVPGRKLMYK